MMSKYFYVGRTTKLIISHTSISVTYNPSKLANGMDTRNNWQIGPGHSCHYTLLSYWHRMDDTKLVTVILWIHNYHINTPSSESICDQLLLGRL